MEVLFRAGTRSDLRHKGLNVCLTFLSAAFIYRERVATLSAANIQLVAAAVKYNQVRLLK